MKDQISPRGFIALLAFESMAATVFLASLPRDPKNSLILGFSAQRLILILGMLVVFFLFAYLYFRSKTSWLNQLANGRWYLAVIIILAIGFLACFTVTQLQTSLLNPVFLAFYERLIPILFWLWIVSLELILYLSWLRFGWDITALSGRRSILLSSAICAAAFLVITIFVLVSRLGITHDTEGWRKMGAPLLMWQITLAFLLGFLLLRIDRQNFENQTSRTRLLIDAGLMLALYGLALALWLPQPLQNSYFSPEIRPPNHEVYPYSDALYYSTAAESVTIGEGLYANTVTPRPFYLATLSYITALAKGDYAGIITWQTLILALIPVFLYLIGRQLMGRPLGFAVGLLGVFRELNAIQSTRYIELSNSKMILADLPALLAILVCTWLLIRWWKNHRVDWMWSLGIGGLLGWVMLFRTQAVLIALVVLVYLILDHPGKWKSWMARFGLVCVGMLFMILPWLVRNYALTGQIIFDDPATQTQFLQQRLGMDVRDPNLNGTFIQLVVRNPGAILAYTTNHFMRNEIATLFVTPPQRFVETVDTVMTEYPFWRDDQLTLTTGQAIQLILILGLMGLGIGALFARWRWAGLIPLAVNLAYTLSNALARNSSGRYNLPVDWVGYLYMAAGLLQIATWVLQGFNQLHVHDQTPGESIADEPAQRYPARKVMVVIVVLLMIGAFIPVTEMIFPARYQWIERGGILPLLKQWGISLDEADIMVSDSDSYLYGRELYPRFYRPGVGEMGSTWAAYAPLDFCRMGFVMVGPQGVDQVIITLDRPPKLFPNRSDTLVIGQMDSALVRGRPVEYLHAEWIIQPGTPPVVLHGLPEPPDRCRLQ